MHSKNSVQHLVFIVRVLLVLAGKGQWWAAVWQGSGPAGGLGD